MKVVATSKNIKPITKADKLYEQFMENLQYSTKCPDCGKQVEISRNTYMGVDYQVVRHCPRCGWHKFYE